MSDTSSPVHGDKPTVASPMGMKDHKELSAAAFERTRMPMVLSDARQRDCPIVMANQAFLDLTGYTSEEILGRNCRFLQGEGTSPAAVAEIRLAVAEGRGVDVELLNYKKDGSPFWNQLHVSAILDDEGEVAYFFASQIDVTAYRKIQSLEASEHRLLMEVDHRTKNVLAIVDSIVRLSKAENVSAYAASVQHRVQSLAQAHMLLAQGGWRAVDLRKLLEAQIARYRHARISVEGPEVLIPPVDVQPLSLVFHELVVNAVTHGSLASTRRGRLEIEWKATHGSGFDLVWRETDGPLRREEPPSGFGTVIARALVEKQLAGQLDRAWTDDGVRIEMSLPDRTTN